MAKPRLGGTGASRSSDRLCGGLWDGAYPPYALNEQYGQLFLRHKRRGECRIGARGKRQRHPPAKGKAPRGFLIHTRNLL